MIWKLLLKSISMYLPNLRWNKFYFYFFKAVFTNLEELSFLVVLALPVGGQGVRGKAG